MRQLRPRRAVAGVTAFVLAFVALVVAISIESLIIDACESPLPKVRPNDAVHEALAVLMIGVAWATSLWTGLFVMQYMLRHGVSKHVAMACCPICRYSMLGLPIDDGAVICPECGRRNILAEQGLTPESIISRGSTGNAQGGRTDGATP